MRDLTPEEQAWLDGLKNRANAPSASSSLIASKVRSEAFPDVRDQERQIIETLNGRLASYHEALRLCDGILQIRNQPGWREFAKTLDDAHQARLHELEAATDAGAMTRLQGRCQELASICALIRRTENNRQALAEEIERLQAEKRSIETQVRPKEQV